MGSAVSLPAHIDKETVQKWAGDKFDEAAFSKAAAGDGTISRGDLLTAAGISTTTEPTANGAEASSRPAETIAFSRTPQGRLEQEMSTVALSLAREKVGDQFLGCEVQKLSNVEEQFKQAWLCLNRGDVRESVGHVDVLLQKDQGNEKYFYTRAVGYARLAQWQFALADYSSYIKMTKERGNLSGPALANAHYGRALCLAKLGHLVPSLRDLNECLRVGPEDEQLTEPDTSLVPCAAIAKFALLSAHPQLGKAARELEREQQREQEQQVAGAGASTAAASSAAESSSYEGPVWRVLVTDLELAIEKACAAGKTPLLLDSTSERAVDQYYLYTPATVIQAKRLVLQVRVAGVSLLDAREELRRQLVHAMRWGHTLVVQMSNTAADFAHAYCDDASFPSALFDRTRLPIGAALPSAEQALFSALVRPSDLSATGGQLTVPRSFRVVVTSTFAPASYEELLKGSLPLPLLQPMHVVMRGSGGSGGDGGKALLKGQTAEGQLTADRTTLVLQAPSASAKTTLGELQQTAGLASQHSYSAAD